MGMVAACADTIKAQTVDEIMTKHEKAVGGLDNWNKIKTIKMDGSTIQGGMEINMTQTFITEKAMRTDISFMGMNGFQIITKDSGWAYMPFLGQTDIIAMPQEAVQSIQAQISPKHLQMLDYKTAGTKIELAGKDTVNTSPCYKLKCTNSKGDNSFCYIDIATYYLLRTEMTVKISDQEQEISLAFNNYQKLPEGVVMPMTMTAQGADIIYKSIEINKPVDEKIFIPHIEK